MSFATDIYTLMNSSTTLNNAVDGIYYQIVPDTPALSDINVVYTFSLMDSIDHLAKNNEIDIYNLNINVVAQDTATLNTIIGYIRALLDNYSTSPFRDIKVQSTETDPAEERDQYIATLNYKIHYQN